MKNTHVPFLLAALAATTMAVITRGQAQTPELPGVPTAATPALAPTAPFALAQTRAGEMKAAPRAMSIGRGSGGGRVLVIPKGSSDPKSLAEIEEDMNVMSHILDKAAISDEKGDRAMGIWVFSTGRGSASPQNIFIEGHGAILFLNVNYPLAAPPPKESRAEAKEKTSSEWEEARREISRPRGFGDAFTFSVDNFENEAAWGGSSPADYDADRVEDLKKNLISALKNAANIRALKGDEIVTVVVGGSGPRSAAKAVTMYGSSNSKAEPAVIAEAPARGRNSPAKLVVRVRKADAEACQKGEMSLEDFRKKADVLVY